MTQADPQNQNRSAPSKPVWIWWLVAGVLVFGCACSLGAFLFLRQAGGLGWVQNLWPLAAPTSTPAPTHTAQAILPSPTSKLPTTASTPTGEPAATTVPTQAATAVPTSVAQPAATVTRPPAPTAIGTTAAVPTPFVCDSLYELANIQKLAPGQTFRCTIGQQELTDLANTYPDSPCSEARFEFDDGEIDVECRMGVRMQATLAAQAQNCRVGVKVLRGTAVFKRVVQELITTQFNVIRYDTICVDQLEIDNGQLTVGGYGR